MMLKENYASVEEKIAKACQRAGRDRRDVTLIAVSKTHPVSLIEEILDTGCVDFGENKVQELTEKEALLTGRGIRWHLIGHLQRNKVKYIVGKTELIHSVDSLRLARQIEQDFSARGLTADILIEVNVAEEESKFGVTVSEAPQLVEAVSALPHVRIRGLMTIAPYTDHPEDNRQYFSKLRELSVDIKQKNIDNVSMDILSMGMTGDYEVAIEEGATHVRVGTGIFGARSYTQIDKGDK